MKGILFIVALNSLKLMQLFLLAFIVLRQKLKSIFKLANNNCNLDIGSLETRIICNVLLSTAGSGLSMKQLPGGGFVFMHSTAYQKLQVKMTLLIFLYSIFVKQV